MTLFKENRFVTSFCTLKVEKIYRFELYRAVVPMEALKVQMRLMPFFLEQVVEEISAFELCSKLSSSFLVPKQDTMYPLRRRAVKDKIFFFI